MQHSVPPVEDVQASPGPVPVSISSDAAPAEDVVPSAYQLQRPVSNPSACSNSSVSENQLQKLKTAQAHAQRHYTRPASNDCGTSEELLEVSHHYGRPVSLLSALASGAINFLLMFGLCCSYGMIMFDEETNRQHQALGVKMNLATSAFVGFLVSVLSGVPVAIAGPDLNPVVFLGTFVSVISQEIGKSLSMNYPGASECGRRLEEADGLLDSVASAAARTLAEGSCLSAGPEFCGDLDEHTAEQCLSYNQQLVTTVIFSVAVSSAIMALVFFLLGRFNLTRYLSFIPTSISEAFLSCVGYKVFKFALKFSNNDPAQFMPAAFIGVLMYFVKTNHWGNPAVVMPLMLLVPLGIFHVCVHFGVFFESLDVARDEKVMFPTMENVDFWLMWTEGIADGNEWKFQYINFGAWTATLPDLATMVIVVIMDALLKVKNVENKLPIVPDTDYEVLLYSGCNVLTSLCGAPVGYTQLKFNVINFGILGNVIDRRAGIIYAGLSALCFFWTIEPFNYLPRFFLSTLLFFAGAGFVAENLWGSRRFLSFHEWLEIILIVLVFIATDQMVYAVVAGGLIATISFLVKYSRVPALAGPPTDGGDITSYERRHPLLQLTMQHIADSWFMVVRLKGFVFFASAKSVVREVTSKLRTEGEFEVVLRPDDGRPLGFTTAISSDGTGLVVREVRTNNVDTWVAGWNVENPDRKLHAGDVIVQLNGKRGDAKDLRSLLEEREGTRATAKTGLVMKVWREELPHYRRLRWVVFDCELLDGMDASASAIFRKLVAQAKEHGCEFLWTHMKPVLKTALDYRGILASHKDVFEELDQAVLYIEQHILEYRREKLDLWMQVHPGLAARHDQTAIAACFDPFLNVFETDAERRGCPWKYCKKLILQQFSTVLWEPGVEADSACLFLVHSGAVGIYEELPSREDADGLSTEQRGRRARSKDKTPEYHEDGEWHKKMKADILPAAVYGHGWFLNREFLLHAPTRMHAIAIKDGEVLYWTREQWSQMQRERPLMAAAIVKAAMRQLARDTDSVERAGVAAVAEAGRGAFGRSTAHVDDSLSPTPHGSHVSRRSRAAEILSGIQSGMQQQSSVGRKLLQLRPAAHLPQELRIPLQRLATARALEQPHLDFWAAPGPNETVAALPKLPEDIKDDLLLAFDMYAHQVPMPDESESRAKTWLGGAHSTVPRLRTDLISQALMFAGMFGIELNGKEVRERDYLTEGEFVALAHQALVSPLTESQKERVVQIFKEHDTDSSGTLYRTQLPGVFGQVFNITHFEEIDSAAREVDHQNYHGLQEGQVNEEGFLWIVGRLVRKHEQDFMLLRALRELTGKGTCTEESQLTLEMLKRANVKKASGEVATDEDWEEMIWAINFSEKKGGAVATHETEVCFNAVMATVIAQEQMRRKLPELDPRKFVCRAPGAVPKLVDGQSAAEQDVRRFVIDQRTLPIDQYKPDKRCEEAHSAFAHDQISVRSTIESHGPVEIVTRSQVEEQFQLDTGERQRWSAGAQEQKVTAKGLRVRLFVLFQHPESSLAARQLSLCLVVLICLSIVAVCAEALFEKQSGSHDMLSSPWWCIELVFTLIFTIEFLIRLSVCNAMGSQTVGQFFMTPSNVFDFVSILPLYLEVIFSSISVRELHLFRLMRLIRLSRAIRVERLTRWFNNSGAVFTVLVVIWGIYLKETGGAQAQDC